jgi:alanine racemase
MQFEAKVIFIKTVPAGTTVSYNRTWTAPGTRQIATIAAGYADGYYRALSNRVTVMINGQTYPQVGTITMDQIMVDLGTHHDVKTGDKAILFGWDGASAEELAEIAGTISYEMLCSVSSRVKRIFV